MEHLSLPSLLRSINLEACTSLRHVEFEDTQALHVSSQSGSMNSTQLATAKVRMVYGRSGLEVNASRNTAKNTMVVLGEIGLFEGLPKAT